MGDTWALWGSFMWALSGIDNFGVLMEWLDGKYDELGFFDWMLWILVRTGWNTWVLLGFLGNLNYDWGVYARNA